MAVPEPEAVDIAATKAAIAENLTTACNLAAKIVFPWEQDRVEAKLREARAELDAGASDDPEAARALGRRMNSILFDAFQAGLNVHQLDELKGSLVMRTIDQEKSNQMYGEMNGAIFRAKSGAWNLQFAR